MELSIRWNNVKISLDIKDRITIVRGDSGTCKTMLVTKLLDGDDSVVRTFPMEFLALPATALSTIQSTRDVLFIMDDVLFFSDVKRQREFQRNVSEYAVLNNLYFLIVERSVVELTSLSYSAYSVYNMVEISPGNFVGVEAYTYLDDVGANK